MFFLPITLIFIGHAIVFLIYTLKNHKQKRQKKIFTNELIVSMLFFAAGLLSPFMYQSHNPTLDPNILNFLWLTSSIFIIIEEILWFFVIFYVFIVCKKNPSLKIEKNHENFKKYFTQNWNYDFRKDIERKIIHIIPIGVIFLIWTIGNILNLFGVLTQWNIDVYSYCYWIIITIGFGFVLMVAIADILKLNKTYLLPNWAVRWYRKSMIADELETYVSSTPLVLCFVPFIFAPFPIFASVALITTVSDATASLIGKKYGKHKIFEQSNKTIEGFIAGFTSTFLIVVLITIIYHSFMPVNLGTILIMATVAAFLFLIIDIFSKHISDNILNPILIGLGMWIIFVLI